MSKVIPEPGLKESPITWVYYLPCQSRLSALPIQKDGLLLVAAGLAWQQVWQGGVQRSI